MCFKPEFSFLEKSSTKNAFVKVTKLDGSIVVVKVSTLVKIFRSQPARMGSDRLQRFIRSYPGHDTKIETTEISTPGIYSVVNIGDWCLFNVKHEFKVAQVLGFQYKTPKGRYKPFRLETAPVEGYHDDQSLVVHGSFYTINDCHQLENCYFKFPLYVKRYAGHINPPQKVGGMLLLDDKSILLVNELVITLNRDS